MNGNDPPETCILITTINYFLVVGILKLTKDRLCIKLREYHIYTFALCHKSSKFSIFRLFYHKLLCTTRMGRLENCSSFGLYTPANGTNRAVLIINSDYFCPGRYDERTCIPE